MFLFSIFKDGKTSYLLGTSHYSKLDLLPPAVKDLIYTRKVVAIESNLLITKLKTEGTEIAQKLGFLKKFVEGNEAQKNLYNFISDEVIAEKVKLYIKQHNLPFSIEDLTDKGVFFLYLISKKPYEGMDDSINRISTEMGKKIVVLDERTQDEEKPFDILYLKAPELLQEFYIKGAYMDFCYGSGLVNRAMIDEDNGEFYEVLVKNRNLIWIQKIKSLHQDEAISCFGVSHLFTQFGILNMLFAESYEIMRINYKGKWNKFNKADLELIEENAPYNDFIYSVKLGFTKQEIVKIAELASRKNEKLALTSAQELISFSNKIEEQEKLEPEESYRIDQITCLQLYIREQLYEYLPIPSTSVVLGYYGKLDLSDAVTIGGQLSHDSRGDEHSAVIAIGQSSDITPEV